MSYLQQRGQIARELYDAALTSEPDRALTVPWREQTEDIKRAFLAMADYVHDREHRAPRVTRKSQTFEASRAAAGVLDRWIEACLETLQDQHSGSRVVDTFAWTYGPSVFLTVLYEVPR